MSGSSSSASGREATHWLPLLLKEHIIHKQCYNQLSEGCQGTLKINNVNKTNKLHESARSQSFAFCGSRSRYLVLVILLLLVVDPTDYEQ
jgi:hypothetical protein